MVKLLLNPGNPYLVRSTQACGLHGAGGCGISTTFGILRMGSPRQQEQTGT